jgi:hypothetical protein
LFFSLNGLSVPRPAGKPRSFVRSVPQSPQIIFFIFFLFFIFYFGAAEGKATGESKQRAGLANGEIRSIM